MTDKEALTLALEALEDLGMKHFESTGEVLYKETFTAIKEALAQPEQEPVVFNTLSSLKHKKTVGPIESAMSNTTQSQPEIWEKFCDSNCVWTDHHPDCKLAQRTWVGLTDEEIKAAIPFKDLSGEYYYDDVLNIILFIQAKLKEKNAEKN